MSSPPPPPTKPTPNASADAVRAIIGDPFAWCAVPAGEFLYGDDKHTLNLDYDFAIAKYPITYTQYQVFIDAADGFKDARWWAGLALDQPTQPEDQAFQVDDHPRANVTWYDAIAFCRWLSFKLGGGFNLDQVDQWAVRLPTEFEWEKAARGTKALIYPYGDEYDQHKSNTTESGIHNTTPVTTYPQGASSYGALDMSGNVWEWCLSAYDNPQLLVGDDNMLSGDNQRCLRGGSWGDNRGNARASVRFGLNPYRWFNNGGFRLIGSPPIS